MRSTKLFAPYVHVISLFLSAFIPFMLIALCFMRYCLPDRGGEFWWSGFFITVLGFFMTLTIVQSREKRLKLSVELLVEERLKRYQDNNFLNSETEKNYKDEVELLKKKLEESISQQDHQSNLLQSSITKGKERVFELGFELERKNEELRIVRLENSRFETATQHELDKERAQKEDIQSSLNHKESLLTEYQETIKEQRTVIEKKQRTISKLEGKVDDLMYEIRSLLKLEESAPSFIKSLSSAGTLYQEASIASPIHIPPFLEEASTNFTLSSSLQKCIGITEDHIGIDHLGYLEGKTPRFLDLSLDHSFLDLRALFEQFREEIRGFVALCDFKEQKVLFVSPAAKELLGWTAEKFTKDFLDLIIHGREVWKRGFNNLSHQRESYFTMTFRAKEEQEDVPLKVSLGWILKGPFSQHILAVFIVD